MYIYFLVLIVNIINVLSKRKSKRVLPFLSFIYLGVLSGQEHLVYNSDSVNYLQDYQNLESFGYTSRFEWLYVFLEKKATNLNLDYQTFRLIFMVAGFFLLFFAVYRLVNNVSLFYCFFAIINFAFECYQIRTFFMFVLFLCAVSISKTNHAIGKIIILLLLVLSAGFHTSGYYFMAIYLIAYLLQYFTKIQGFVMKYFTAMSFIVMVALSSSGLTSIVGSFLSKLIQLFSNNQVVIQNVASKFNGGSTRRTVFMYSILMLILIYSVFASRFMENEDNFIKTIIVLTTISMPLMMLSIDYVRILRYGLILVYIYLIKNFEFSRKKIVGSDLVFIVTTIVCLSFITVMLYENNGNPTFWQSVPFILSFGAN